MNENAHSSDRRIVLGCIADDVTGATDLAINLVQGGMRVVQLLGLPTASELADVDADAVVIALKSRSIPAGDAVSVSLQALGVLREVGVERFFFKYCSTFDSTAEGNIGPVAVALMQAIGTRQTIFCPAFPRNGRTVYQGHLFVHDRLLSESGMESHPLNPMTDSNLVRFLAVQAKQEVGLLSSADIGGANAPQKLASLLGDGLQLVVTDACHDDHLRVLADAAAAMPLVTGGSGIARFLPEAYRASAVLASDPAVPELPCVDGRSLIVSGSCSSATNSQVEWMRSRCPAWEIDVDRILSDSESALAAAVEWVKATDPSSPVLVYSTAAPDKVATLQEKHGVNAVAEAIEDHLASITASLVEDAGIRKIVLAGGETSGAVVNRLGVKTLRIGPEICPGVPWTESIGDRRLALALKSGNFGEEDFFAHALEMIT